MSAQDLWDKLDALPWPGPWVAHTFEIDCPCPNGEHCGDTHDCAEVEDRTAYPASPEKPAEPGHGQCVVQINTPGLETFAKPCAEFIAAARNELPAIRDRMLALESAARNLLNATQGDPNLCPEWEHLDDMLRMQDVVVAQDPKPLRPLADETPET